MVTHTALVLICFANILTRAVCVTIWGWKVDLPFSHSGVLVIWTS